MSSSMPESPDPASSALPANATLDDFLGGRIALLQPRQGHRAGSDTVWLQAAVPAQAGARILDAGAGVGAAGLCLLARVPEARVTAVEIDAELCRMAEANAARNGLAAKFSTICADVTSPAETLFAKGLPREGFDEVMANPPYHRAGTVRTMPARATAHVMQERGLEAWIRFLTTMLAPKGGLTLIHQPEAVAELLPLLDRRFGALTLLPLFAKVGAPATRIILHGRKGSRAGLRLLPGVVLHRSDGRYTDAAEAVLRHGAALKLGTV